MSKQYIGARYVPKFFENELNTAEWRPNVIYEPLTIVTYLANSYTSKKLVPANIGAPDLNAEYWVATGNYNEQVEEYRQEVVEYKAEVEGLADSVEGLEEDIISMHTLKNRKFILIGDSYGAGHSSEYPSGIQSFYDYFVAWNGISSGDYHKNCKDGYAFNKPDYQFVTLLQEVEATLSAEEKLEITDIIVCGGANDQSYRTGLASSVTAFISYAHSNFPNAVVSIGMIAYSPTLSQANMRLADVMHYYVNGCKNGARYLSGIENALHKTTLFLSDGHPNEDGQKLLGVALTNCLLEGYATVRDDMYLQNSITFHENIDTSSSTFNSFISTQNDNVIGLYHNDYDSILFVTPVTISNKLGSAVIPIGQLGNTHVTGGHFLMTSFCVPLRLYSNSSHGTPILVIGLVQITNGYMNVTIYNQIKETISIQGFDFVPFSQTFDARFS